MRKILFIFCLFVCLVSKAQYNPSVAGLPINTAIGINYAGSLDSRTMFYDAINFKSRAYVDTTEVFTYLNQTRYRTGFFPIVVNTGGTLLNGVITGGTNALWFYQNGTNRNNLVPMITSGGSTNTSVGGRYRFAINGTNNVKTAEADLGTFIQIDSSQSNIVRWKVDTAGLMNYIVVHYPFRMKVDPTYFQVLGANHDSLTCIGCGGGGGVASIKNWVANIDSLKAHRGTTDGEVWHTSFYSITNTFNSGAQYQWSAASTATGNDHYVLTPTTGSGAGRWLIIPDENNRISTAQYGIIPGATDRGNLNTFNQWAAGIKIVAMLSPGVWVIDTVGLTVYNNMRFYGYGDTSVLKTKAHTNQVKSTIFYYGTAPTDTVKNVEIAFMKFDGNTIYNGLGAISGSSPVTDTFSRAISLRLCDSVNIHHNSFVNGFNNYAMYYTYTSNLNFDDNYGDHIGSAIIGSDYDPNSSNINIRRNQIHWFGMYYGYDAENPAAFPRRNGQDAIQGGGANALIEGNVGYNENQTLCFFLEGRFSGAATIRNNIYYCMGRLTGGYSIGGDIDHGFKCPVLTLTGNSVVNCFSNGYNSRDSMGGKRLYIAGQALNETTYSLNVNFYNNYGLDNQQWSFRQCDSVNWHDEIFNNSGMSSSNGSGFGIFTTFGLPNVTGTDTSRITLTNITATIGDGQVYNFSQNGSLAYVTIQNSTFNFLRDYKVGEMYQPSTSNFPTLSFINNTVTGNITGGGKAFYQYSPSPRPAPYIILDGTNLSKTNIDTSQMVGNFKEDFIGSGGQTSVFSRIATRFLGVTLNPYFDSLSLSGSVVNGMRNGVAKPQFTIPGAGNIGDTATALRIGQNITPQTIQAPSVTYPAADGSSWVTLPSGLKYALYQTGSSVDFTTTTIYSVKYNGLTYTNKTNLFPSGLGGEVTIGNPNLYVSPNGDSLGCVFFGYHGSGGSIATMYFMSCNINTLTWSTPVTIQTGTWFVGSYDRVVKSVNGHFFIPMDTSYNAELSTQLGHYHGRLFQTGANWRTWTRQPVNIVPLADSAWIESGIVEVPLDRNELYTSGMKLVWYARNRSGYVQACESYDSGITWSVIYNMGNLAVPNVTMTMKAIGRNTYAIMNRQLTSAVSDNQKKKELILYVWDGYAWVKSYIIAGTITPTVAYHEGSLFYDSTNLYIAYSNIDSATGESGLVAQTFDRNFYNEGVVGQQNFSQINIVGSQLTTTAGGQIPQLSIFSPTAGHAASYLDITSIYGSDASVYGAAFNLKYPSSSSVNAVWDITVGQNTFGLYYNSAFSINAHSSAGGTVGFNRLLTLANNNATKFEVRPDGIAQYMASSHVSSLLNDSSLTPKKYVDSLFATGGGGSSTLAGLSDVAISSPSNGQALTYNSGTSKWNNTTVTSVTSAGDGFQINSGVGSVGRTANSTGNGDFTHDFFLKAHTTASYTFGVSDFYDAEFLNLSTGVLLQNTGVSTLLKMKSYDLTGAITNSFDFDRFQTGGGGYSLPTGNIAGQFGANTNSYLQFISRGNGSQLNILAHLYNGTTYIDPFELQSIGYKKFSYDPIGTTSDPYVLTKGADSLIHMVAISNFLGGGSSLTSVGSGYKIAVNGTLNVKSVTASNGLIADSSTSNQVGFKLGGSALTGTTQVGGGSQILQFGTAGDKTSSLALYSSGGIYIGGQPIYFYVTATDANVTVASDYGGVELPTITANRTVTLSTGGASQGAQMIVYNQNTSAFTWTFASTVKDLAGNTITAIPNGIIYTLVSDGTNYVIQSVAKSLLPLSITSSSTPTPNWDLGSQYNVTALAANATFADPIGTPADGQTMIIRIKDNGTARTLSWGSAYRAGSDFALPTTTVLGKVMYVQIVWDAADSKADVLGLTQGF